MRAVIDKDPLVLQSENSLYIGDPYNILTCKYLSTFIIYYFKFTHPFLCIMVYEPLS